MIETMSSLSGFDCDENPNLALKLIFSAESETDNYVPLVLCDQVSQKAQKIVSFCMGQMGIYSRVMSLRHGASFLHHLVLPRRLAKYLWEILNHCIKMTKIFGINMVLTKNYWPN